MYDTWNKWSYLNEKPRIMRTEQKKEGHTPVDGQVGMEWGWKDMY